MRAPTFVFVLICAFECARLVLVCAQYEYVDGYAYVVAVYLKLRNRRVVAGGAG